MSRRNRMFTARTLVLGGLAAAAAAAALKNRTKVAGLIGIRSSEPEPYRPSPSTPDAPPISNYDAPGPPANTATPVPAPDPVIHEDRPFEEAEEEAAAAEAGAIGGTVSAYATGTPGETVDEEDRPLEEAGEGVSEGLEQAEADLVDNAEPAAGDPIEGERQVDEVIEEQDEPGAGEAIEVHDHVHSDEVEDESSAPLQPETVDDGAPVSGGTARGTTDPGASETSAAEKSAAVWRADDQPTAEQPPVSEGDEEAPSESKDDSDDNGSEWQTWSGRAVDR